MKHTLYIVAIISSCLFLIAGFSVAADILDYKSKVEELSLNLERLQAFTEVQRQEFRDKTNEIGAKVDKANSKIQELERKLKELKLPKYSFFSEKNRIVFEFVDETDLLERESK